jgi:Xaa-Pro aminopeptidase
MRSHEFDAVLLVGSNNVIYFTGYPRLERSVARPFFLLIPREGPPVLLVQEGRAMEASRFSWIADVRTYAELSRAPIVELQREAERLKLGGRRIGLELGLDQRIGLAPSEWDRLKGALAGNVLADASPLLWSLRQRKSADEVASIRAACVVTAKAFRSVLPRVKAGEVEAAIARRVKVAMLRGGAGDTSVSITSGGGNYDLASSPGSRRRLEAGDMLWLDAGCTVRSYWSDFSRSAVVGSPSRDQAVLHQAVRDITAQAVAMVRPGGTVAEIAEFCNAGLDRLGVAITSSISGRAGRVGHGIGLDSSEPPDIAEHDPTVLRSGMVFSIEPGVATEYGIFHCEEDVVVTRTGVEVLSDAPRDLISLP